MRTLSKNGKSAFLAAAACGWAIAAAPANAQDVGESEAGVEADAGGQNAIIVTAQRREQTLQEVPLAVSVLSAEELENSGVSAVDTLVDVVPSLTFTKGFDDESSSLSIRGIGTTVFSSAVEPSVSVVVDDVVMARNGQAFQDLIAIERVEVLRGPQSTLFGKNASAGVLSVTTKKPTFTLSGKVDTIATEDGEFQQRATVSGPLSDKVAARLTGYYKDYDGGSINRATGKRLNGWETFGFHGKLLVEPSDALSLMFNGDYRHSDANPQAAIRSLYTEANADLLDPVVPGEENTEIVSDADIFANTEAYGGSLTATYKFANDFELTSVSAYREWSQYYNSDVDHTANDPRPDLVVVDPDGSTPAFFSWNQNGGTYDLSQISQEIRLASPSYDGFDFLVGLFFFNHKLEHNFARRWVNPTVSRSGQYTGNVETTNYAGFVSGNVYPAENLTIFGGLRLLHEKLEYSVFRDPTNVFVEGDSKLPGGQGTKADFADSISDTAVTGNIGLRYDVSDLGNVYASYARGYKGAGFNMVFAASEEPPVKPETVDAFEIGLKMSTPDNVLSTNIALFYTDYRNYQAQSRGESIEEEFSLRNAGSLTTKGIEVEAFIRPSEHTRINLGAAYIKAKITEFPGGPCYFQQTEEQGCVDGAQDLAGGDLPNSPDFKLTGGIRQGIPIESLPFNAFVQANGTYQSEVQYALTQDPRTKLDGYAIINASIGIEADDGSYSFQIFGRNLTDKFYPGELFPSPGLGGRVTQQVARDNHRYFGVQGSVSF
ncbi:TonB-dependent receptor [Croceicoccus bisphenolivorans]|uniref:TonB-dependent receptor n=1 Tax=Croceicoccus bisphenolivorans TaxID=1783232 RepID=UPI000830FA92|nr:TonB-dependent receptor [Croceicoccus bisphenolivorans]